MRPYIPSLHGPRVSPELVVVQERVGEQGDVQQEDSHRHEAGAEGLQRAGLCGAGERKQEQSSDTSRCLLPCQKADRVTSDGLA